MLDPLAEGGQGFQIFQVANMGTKKRVFPFAQAEGILEMTATGQQGARYLKGERDRFRGVAARATEKLLAADDAHHRIIAAHVDLAVMRQHPLSDGAQTLLG